MSVVDRIDEIEKMQRVARDVAGEWFDHMVAATLEMGPIQLLMTDLLYRHNLGMVGTSAQLAEVWRTIDAVPKGAEFVLGLAQRYYLRYECDTTRQAKLTDLGLLSQATSCFQHTKSVIPQEQREEMPKSTIIELYEANRWFVPLLLLAMQAPISFVLPETDRGTPEGRE